MKITVRQLKQLIREAASSDDMIKKDLSERAKNYILALEDGEDSTDELSATHAEEELSEVIESLQHCINGNRSYQRQALNKLDAIMLKAYTDRENGDRSEKIANLFAEKLLNWYDEFTRRDGRSLVHKTKI